MSAAQDPKFRFALRSDTGLLQIERFVGPAKDGKVFVVWGYEHADAPFLIGSLVEEAVSVLRVSESVVTGLSAGHNIAVSKEHKAAASYTTPSAPLFGPAQFRGVQTE